MTIRPVGSQLFRAVRRTDGHDEAIRRYMELFVSTVFYNNRHLQWMYKLLQQFMLQLYWIRRLDVNKYCKWTHSSRQRYQQRIVTFTARSIYSANSPCFHLTPVWCFQYPIRRPSYLTETKFYPLVQSLPDGSACVYKFPENVVIYSCVSLCQTGDCQLLYTDRDVTFIKITCNVNNEIFKKFWREYLISRNKLTAHIISQYWQLWRIG